MNPNTSSAMITILLMFGGAIFGVLGALHTVYTLLDLRKTRRLVPEDPSVAQAMANSAVRLSSGGTNMWRAWIGFNFSHGLGVLLVGTLAVFAGSRAKALPVGIIIPGVTLISCIYLVLALLYWFRAPAIAVALASGCFAAAWVLSLK